MRLISWNVNGIRAVMKKDFMASLTTMNPDVLCLQETKAQDDQTFTALEPVEGYHIYTNSAEKKGYSGTAILTREEPIAGADRLDAIEVLDHGRAQPERPLVVDARLGVHARRVDSIGL